MPQVLFQTTMNNNLDQCYHEVIWNQIQTKSFVNDSQLNESIPSAKNRNALKQQTKVNKGRNHLSYKDHFPVFLNLDFPHLVFHLIFGSCWCTLPAVLRSWCLRCWRHPHPLDQLALHPRPPRCCSQPPGARSSWIGRSGSRISYRFLHLPISFQAVEGKRRMRALR